MKALLIFLISINIYAGPTRVGNGDDGSDLEGFVELKSGKIVEARDLALKRLKKLHTEGLPLLGNLIPEVQNSKLYITKRNIEASELKELGAYHADTNRRIYARTFPRPYAATRFFPVAKSLDKDQLVALHIHEALHRSLPVEFREDEEFISKLTRQISSPDATHDSLYSYLKKYGKHTKTRFDDDRVFLSLDSALANSETSNAGFKTPSFYLTFQAGISPIANDVHALQFMAGLSEISAMKHSLKDLKLGARYRFKTANQFDMYFYGNYYLNLASKKDTANYIAGRDRMEFGVLLKGFSGSFYGENEIRLERSNELKGFGANGDIDFKAGDALQVHGRMYYISSKFLYLGGIFNLLVVDQNVTNSSELQTNSRDTLINLGPSIRVPFTNKAYLQFDVGFAVNDFDEQDSVGVNDLLAEELSSTYGALKLMYFL